MEENNVSAALAAGKGLAELQKIAIPNGTNIPAFVLPENYTLHIPDEDALAPYLLQPLRTKGNNCFADTDSFVRYFNEHKNDLSRIFAKVSDNAATFEGILNMDGPDHPDFRDHKCSVNLRPTHEWTVWLNHNRKPKTQPEFATFLEENADMFTDPTGLDLLTLIQTLEGKADVQVKQAIKLQNGGIEVNYTEDIELRGSVVAQDGKMLMPTMLTVGIAPFEGVARYSMTARLRYRIADRKITFWYEAVTPHLFVREVVADITKVIMEQTGVIPYRT